MNRRSFFGKIGQAMAGCLAFVLPTGLAVKANERVGKIVRERKPPANHYMAPFRSGDRMDFHPDEIVSLQAYEGKLFVACKHSVWILEVRGDYVERQPIAFNTNYEDFPRPFNPDCDSCKRNLKESADNFSKEYYARR